MDKTGTAHGPSGMTDEQLAVLAHNGDDPAVTQLLSRMIPAARALAAKYAGDPEERADLTQEAMFGLLSAIHCYDESAGASFKTFAALCMKRRMITAVKAAKGRKHIPLSNYISLSGKDDIIEAADNGANPEDVLIAREDVARITGLFRKNLSGFEQDILRLYLSGRSYEQIAVRLGCDAKSVDNAIQRIRRKLRKLI